MAKGQTKKRAAKRERAKHRRTRKEGEAVAFHKWRRDEDRLGAMYVAVALVLVITNGLVYSTARNKIESPLLALPGEIRNFIYKYVLGGMEVVPLQYDRRFWVGPWTLKDELQPWPVFRPLLDVLGACRQIQWEAALLPYMLNTFVSGSRYYLAWVEDDFISMHGMISRLSDAPRHAIRAIGLPCNGVVYNNEYPRQIPDQIQHSRLFTVYSGYPIIPTRTLRELSGVRSVIMYSKWSVSDGDIVDEGFIRRSIETAFHCLGRSDVNVVCRERRSKRVLARKERDGEIEFFLEQN
jgi:hypothetical protein